MNKLISIKDRRINDKSCRRYKNATNDKLYLTIADGDFKVSQALLVDVTACVQTGDVSYKYQEDNLFSAVNKWYKKSWNIDFEQKDILFANGVLYWIHVAIYAFSKKNENVLVMPPVYDPFYKLIAKTNRHMTKSNLIFQDNKWAIDFVDLEKKMSAAKILILCSPHNPTGNVWSKQELERINNLAIKYNVVLVADEIWQDIILSGKFTHSLTLENVSKIIHIASPTKTYNMGGLHYGHIICKNKQLMNKLTVAHDSMISYSSSQPWITAAIVSAYTNPKNEIWKNDYLTLLKDNAIKLTNFLKKNHYNYAYPQGVFLMFIELGDESLHSAELQEELFDLGADVSPGSNYGEEYKTWIRVNIAICSEDINLFIRILENFKQKQKEKHENN